MPTVNQHNPKIDNILLIASLILLVGALLLLNGCKTCPPASVVEKTVEKEVIKMVPHDSLIYISSDPVHIYHQLSCDSLGIIKAFKKTFRSNGIKAVVEVKNNELSVDCEADSLKKVITLLNTEKNAIIEHSKSEVKIETKVVNSWYVKYLCWISLVLFIYALWQNRKRIASLFV